MRGADAKLDLFSEMQLFRQKHLGMSAEELLRMVTTRAARALGWARQVGEISVDAWVTAAEKRGKFQKQFAKRQNRRSVS